MKVDIHEITYSVDDVVKLKSQCTLITVAPDTRFTNSIKDAFVHRDTDLPIVIAEGGAFRFLIVPYVEDGKGVQYKKIRLLSKMLLKKVRPPEANKPVIAAIDNETYDVSGMGFRDQPQRRQDYSRSPSHNAGGGYFGNNNNNRRNGNGGGPRMR